MAAITRLFFVILFCLVTLSVSSAGDDDLLQINKLRKRLLKDQSYQRNSRPVVRHTTVTNVSLTIFIRKIVSLDVSTGTLTMYATLSLEWIDEHLHWSPSEFGGLEDMTFDFYEIWSPDVRSWSAVEGGQMSRSVGRDPLRVSSTGLVSWWTRAVVKSHCFIDLTDFPFDQQVCSIGFVSWTFDSMHLNLTSNNKFSKQVYGPFTKNPEWAVVKKTVHPNDLNVSEIAWWHSVGLELVLQRRNEMYKYRTVIPYFTAWAFALFSFMSDVGSNRRLVMSSVAVAIYLMLMIQLSLQLGPHSIHTPYAIKCLGMSLVIVTASLIISAVIQVVSRKMTRSNVILPRSMTQLLDSNLTQTILFLKQPETAPADPGDTRLLDSRAAMLVGRDWQLMTQLVDRLCLLSFIVTAVSYHS